MDMKKQYLIEMDTETKKLSNELLETYSINDLQELLNALNTDVFKEILFQHMFENFDGNNPICPYCGSKHIRKHGFTKDGKQRYRCSCKKTFILQRNTLMYWSRLSCIQWKTIICSTLNNDSLERIAALAGISVTYAFYCRHKVMYVLVQLMNEDILLDEAELDETYINYQEEGYIRKGKRGISEDKIGIACAIDKYDHTVLYVADRGRPTSKTLIDIFDKKMTHGMTIISDSQRSYHPLMRHLKEDWKKIPSRKKEVDGYTLERINDLHEEIKTFFRGKRNVMTHYLLGYLALFQFRKKEPLFLLDSVLKTLFYRLNCIKTALRNKDICSGVNIYRTYYKL